MCGRLCCPFRRAGKRTAKDPENDDDLTRILIFGVTGVTGGAVMEACTSCAWFITTGFTRATDGDFYDLLRGKDINVVSGDMGNYHSVLSAMDGIDTVFLTTHYWESMSTENEFIQGYNVINAAMASGVRHLIYASTDYSVLTCDWRCKYLEGKARIEQFISNCGIPSTIVHNGFFFENFLGLFKPHRTGKHEYALAMPLGQMGLNMCSVLDYGQCIAEIALKPKKFLYSTIKLAAEYLTVDEITEKFNINFSDPDVIERRGMELKFWNPKITMAEYKTLDFPAVEDLSAMWMHYRNSAEWDSQPIRSMFPQHYKLDKFIKEREKAFVEILSESEKPPRLSRPSKAI